MGNRKQKPLTEAQAQYIPIIGKEQQLLWQLAITLLSYPVIGWWRERKHLGKVETQTRYTLIISLETPAQDVELYTTVRNMIEVPVEINTI